MSGSILFKTLMPTLTDAQFLLRNRFQFRRLITFVVVGKNLSASYSGNFFPSSLVLRNGRMFYFENIRFQSSNRGGRDLMNDCEAYLQICHEIENLNTKEISVRQLAYLPYATLKHRQELRFVEITLQYWWNLINNRMTELYGRDLVSTAYSLHRLNEYCNGNVLKILTLKRIEKIALFASNEVETFTAQDFELLLRALENFRGEGSLSNELQQKLFVALSTFLSTNVIQKKSSIIDNIDCIIYYSTRLGLDRPSEECIKNVIPICYNVLENEKLADLREHLSRCHLIGSTFLLWNINPGAYFWTRFFSSIKNEYDALFKGDETERKQNQRFYTKILINCLLIGLKYCENEFKESFSQFWKSEMTSMQQYLRKAEIEEMLNLCIECYVGDLSEIENILSKNILDTFLSRTELFICIDDKLLPSGEAADNDERSPEIDETNYHLISRQLNEVNQKISGRILNKIPQAVVKFHKENDFVDNVSRQWWLSFKERLDEVHDRSICHTLYNLHRINSATKGRLVKEFGKFTENPFEKMIMNALKHVNDEKFTLYLFSLILRAMDLLFLYNTRPAGLPSCLREEIMNAFHSIFDPNLFDRRLHRNSYYKDIGNMLYRYTKILTSKPPDEARLEIIIKCCSEIFVQDLTNLNQQAWKDRFYNLQSTLEVILLWNIDPNKYYAQFWTLFFKDVKNNFFKYNEFKNVNYLLNNILLVVLNFDQENEFEHIKLLWQSEMWSKLKYLQNDNINKFFSLSKKVNKFEQLEKIVSKKILDEFSRRIKFNS